ncbi:D-aminoacyl-tRNA deacylase [Pseudidiomarina sp.]|uniref:D-aminoacyl-tRNA deacylase n=1 Tax=Pseudidiomarina sp. TaxID=2081707 RepID=UPI00299D59FE|nr:D-aminoacyl-tRNA deacylase [Pseudidiomarina sp.]MDX1706018.1 D-aminoacyl-tRNA deacylase [Pseudidiomarina sp.]
MKVLLQRVSAARVEIDGVTAGAIGQGLLLLLGVERDDTANEARQLAARVAGYRVFSDADDKMNLSVKDINGGCLVVSQFTLAADTRSGRRPSFSSAAPPDQAEPLYELFVKELKAAGINVATGSFGADMAVTLTNDGPVTFLLTSTGKT